MTARSTPSRSVLHNSALLAGGDDTIVARATPDGRGALAIVRVSGPAARRIAHALGAPALGAPGDPWTPRTATRVTVRHPQSGAPLDDAIMIAYVAPHSFTGEDAVEITTHGGRVVSTLVMAACVAAGARVALPGEFTRRAVLNGKLDVLQAEAIGDLIDARTTAMHRHALSQLDGGLSRRLVALRDDVIHLEALLAYDIDFPEEDDGPIAPERITRGATMVIEAIDRLLATAPRAAMLRDGALVVIAGPPNAGKSSLFNALLGESRALVTPIAGTTRDAVDAVLDRAPVPLRLVDTAGLRDTQDTLERLGIEVSERYLASAQVVLACGESAADVERARDAMGPLSDAPVIAVHTKADRLAATDSRRDGWCYVSAESGTGLASLLEAIDAMVATTEGIDVDDIAITRERHQRGLREARDEVRAFLDGWQAQALPATVAAVHLQAARDALSELVGAIGTEDILDRVFADFCIGK